jgi:hypothetical protein
MIASLKPEIRRLKPHASWPALAERSGDSALLLQDKRRRASLAAAVQRGGDVRPHPCPLPGAADRGEDELTL